MKLDDKELLKLMMNDKVVQSKLYQPTNYWRYYEQKILKELYTYGLNDFRRRRNSILSSFVANDLIYEPRYKTFSKPLNRFLNKYFPIYNPMATTDILRKFAYSFADRLAKQYKAKPPSLLDCSLIGNPEDAFDVEEKNYTRYMLNYYLQYVCCNRIFDFSNIKVMVELGFGCGRQVEIIKKLYPEICFLLFDIPPTLYVGEQYLKNVFPNDVVSYMDTRNMDAIRMEPGKIFIFPNWMFPLLNGLHVNLFWNSASFQEMELDVVNNYLDIIETCTNNIYLRMALNGTGKANKLGDFGSMEPVTFQDIKNKLSGAYNLIEVNESMFVYPVWKEGYVDSFWKRR